jgi:protein phosphatase
MGQNILLKAATGTDPGKLREVNQDTVFASIRSPEKGEALGLFIVADGMGGHKAGEIASQLAVNTIYENLAFMIEQDDSSATALFMPGGEGEELPSHAKILARRLEVAVEEANKAIYGYALENPSTAGNLGCTVTCAIISGNALVVANVGDSRTYRLSGDDLSQITNDHSYVWELVQEGHLQSEEIYDHPHRNVITRALGSQEDVPVDLLASEIKAGDRLLLCSDGVWEMIRDPNEIRDLLQLDTLESAADKLVDKANFYGGTDNIGVVVVEYSEFPTNANEP